MIRFALLICIVSVTAGAGPRKFDLTTLAEQTAYAQTGRYDEVTRLCHDFASAYPRFVRCQQFGTTPERRPMWVLVASRTGAITPAAARARRLPVVLVQGGIHAGEIDGKDAGFLALRQLLLGGPGALDRLVLVFVPVFNVDGHESRSPFQRPNQVGPAEQGARTTARRINLNRDYLVADAVEMQAMLGLLGAWDPLLLLDLHTTDGARFQHDVSLAVAPAEYGDPRLVEAAKGLRADVIARLTQEGHLPLPFYPRLLDVDDPGAGLVADVDAPRHSHAYWGLRNRLGVLVEDHSWRPYADRVATCRDTVLAFLEAVARRAPELQASVAAADKDAQGLGGTRLDLAFDTVTEGDGVRARTTVAFKTYAFEVLDEAPVSGGRGLVYHPDRPITLDVPFFDDVRPVPGTTVTLPRGGYLVPAAWAPEVADRLRWHGVVFRELKQGWAGAAVEVQRASPAQAKYDEESFQGRQMLELSAGWSKATASVGPGSLFVPIAQSRALLAAHLLEPQAPDSLSAWGLFNAAYEVNDYPTRYRALELARWMHDGDTQIREIYGAALFGRLPALRLEFERRIKSNPVFADSPRQRLQFWMNELPPQDPKLGEYPILRTDVAPP